MPHLPRVAIVGRPNVGKSSLFNMIAGHLVSIVDPTPGVTRDRISFFVDLVPPDNDRAPNPRRSRSIPAPDFKPVATGAKACELIDTGGYGIYSGADDDPDSKALSADVERQIAQAIAEADLILFVVDAQTGLTPLDHAVAELLRDRGASPRVHLVANKVDDTAWESHAADAASLGFGSPWTVSATTSHGKHRFLSRLYDTVPASSSRPIAPEMKIAIVGRRNAGKSTLVNSLAGSERVIVSEIPGTTRDSVDVRFNFNGKELIAIDTAGLRKKKSLDGDVDFYAHHRALRSIRRADVVALLIDATEPVSQVDEKLGREIADHFKPCIVVINKWDLVQGKRDSRGRPITEQSYVDYLTKELSGLEYAPCAFISAQKGAGVRDLVSMAFNLFEQAGHRETTGKVNAVIQRLLERRGPSSRVGKRAKVLYVSQIAVHPPTLAFVVNHADLFDNSYQRFLLNRLREQLPFSEVPIRLIFRDRQRVTLPSKSKPSRAHSAASAKFRSKRNFSRKPQSRRKPTRAATSKSRRRS